MGILLTILGVFWIIVGVLLFIFTDATKEIMRNLLKQKNLKPFSILPLLVGIVLIFGSSLVSMPWVTILLGLLALLKGLFLMFGPQGKVKSIIDWWLGTSNHLLRSWGVVMFLLGVLLLLIL